MCLRFGIACAREFFAGSKGWKPRLGSCCVSVLFFFSLCDCRWVSYLCFFVACSLVNAVSQMLKKIGSKVSVK